MTNPDSILKSTDITSPTKVHLVKAMVFPVVTYGCWELDHKESWVLKNWCFWTVVLEKTLESPLDCKEIQPVHPKGDQSWVFTGRTDVAEIRILWLPNAIKKRTDLFKRPWCWERLKAGRDGGNRGWDGWMASPSQWTWVWASSGVGDRQGSLVCCSPRGHKTSDMTEQLNCPTHDFAVFPVPKLQALGLNAKEPTYQCRRCKRCKFVPCVGKIPWRREWFPTPVFLPGKSHGQRSLAGYTAHVVAELNIGE